MSNKLFTVGHSTHTVDHLLNLLKKHEITAVCDVRSMPYSQHNPQFNRETLKEALSDQGISYVFLGKELGARSDNPACYINGKVQYNYLAEEPAFKEGLRRVKKGMKNFQVALMCAEKDPLTCHRTILICRELKADNIEIVHVLADGTLEANSDAEKRLMKMLRIVPDMFHDERQCIEDAYDRQSDKIAYEEKTQAVAAGE
jgi:uncharacterized protein (DUF488 family)